MKRGTLLALVALFLVSCRKESFTRRLNSSPNAAPAITYPSTNSLTVGTAVTITPTNTGGAVPATVYGQVTIIAGSTSGTAGYVDATGTAAMFNGPMGIVEDASHNLFVVNQQPGAVREISPAGVVTSFSGDTIFNGSHANGTYLDPAGIIMDGSGNFIVANQGWNTILKITPAGVVSSYYANTGDLLDDPYGMCFDASGNLIVDENGPDDIVKITPAGDFSVIAGIPFVVGDYEVGGYTNGTGSAAHFNQPNDMRIDSSGNVFIADYLNNAIRKMTPAGVVTTVAGSAVAGNTPGYAAGVGTTAVFNLPSGLAFGPGGVLYVTDSGNNDIRAIMPDGTVTLVAGSATQAAGFQDGIGIAALFTEPGFIYIDNATGIGYITEYSGNRVRKMVLTGYALSGTLPAGLSFDPTTGIISGTPTSAFSATTYTITAYNLHGFSTATITLSAS